MKKIELLAPAGNYECLVAAIQNGADAIYLGGNKFNARAYATNFDEETLKQAIAYAHRYGVKIYVTMNTLYYDEQLDEVLEYVDFLYHQHVDALIVQDAGLIKLVHQMYPDFEIHASTQCSVLNSYGLKRMEQLGVKRVVLARENTIEEIRTMIQSSPLEVEVFVHGALCMSYSGQCLMSSFIGKRSGNRGACAQPCRLPFALKEDGKVLNDEPYLLSLKDLYTLDHIEDFIQAGVTSLKIEGRMKKSEYVAFIVKSYREAIDKAYQNKKMDHYPIKEMELLFNRGFTKGYLFHDSNKLAKTYPSHRGVYIGDVVGYDKNIKSVRVLLKESLKQGDGISFESNNEGRIVNKLYHKDYLVNIGNAKQEVGIEFDLPIKKGTRVFKTSSVDLVKEIRKTFEKEQRKVPVDITLEMRVNQAPKLRLSDGVDDVEVTSDLLCQEAVQTPLTKERIHDQITKLGSTIFVARRVKIIMDERISFSIKALNELRRVGANQLEEKRSQKVLHTLKSPLDKPTLLSNQKRPLYLDVKVNHLSQVEDLRPYYSKISRLYYPFGDDLSSVREMIEHTSIELIPYCSNILKDKEIEAIKNHPLYQDFSTFLIGDYGQKIAFETKRCIEDSSLNTTNSYHLSLQNDGVVLSQEISKYQIQNLKTENEVTFNAYGRVTMMTSEYCPISTHYFNEKKEGCRLCKKHEYTLNDRKNEDFPISMDDHCRMRLYNSVPLYIDDVKDLNVDRILITFTIEKKKEILDVVKDYVSLVLNHIPVKKREGQKYTLGYFYDKK